jgi:hypothetical protein
VETVAGSVFVVVTVVTPKRKYVDGVGFAVGSATVVVLRINVVCVVVEVSTHEYSRPTVVTVDVDRTISTGAVYANCDSMGVNLESSCDEEHRIRFGGPQTGI